MTCMYLQIGRVTSQDILFQVQILNQLHLKDRDDIKLYPTGLFIPSNTFFTIIA